VLSGIAILLVVVFLLLQTNPVQRFLTRKAETFLQQKLDTDLGIGRIGWRFPSAVFLRETYLNSPQGDTVLRVADLAVDLDMWQLLQQRVSIESVRVDRLRGALVTTDTSSNWAFILTAFASPDTTESTTAEPAPEAGAWQIVLDQTDLSLAAVDFLYQDDPAGIRVAAQVGQLLARSRRVDLAAQRYELGEVRLRESDIQVDLAGSDTTATDGAAADLFASSEQISIEQTHYRMTLDSLAIDTYLGSTTLAGPVVQVGTQIDLSAPRFTVTESRFSFDRPVARAAEGIDYNHLDLRQIQIGLADLGYRNDSITLRIDSLAAAERSGLRLLRTAGTVVYQPTGIQLTDFLLQTEHSRLQAPSAALAYDFATTPPLEELELDIDARGYVGSTDVRLLAPQLAQQPLLRDNPGQRIDFALTASGSGRRLALAQADINGPGLVLRANGAVSYPFDTSRLAGELQLQELTALPRPLVALLPAGTLPAYIDWPQRITGAGTFSYRNKRLALDLSASETREAVPLLSQLALRGELIRPTAFPDTYLDLRLDSLQATRPTFLAYLPPGSLPAGYQLPEFVRASGTVTGPLDDLRLDLALELPRRTTYANFSGRIEQVLDPDQLRLDLQIADLGLAQNDVRALLPDSLLPTAIRLPDLRLRQATVSGSLDDLNFSLPIESSNGDWQVAGRYNPRDLSVDIQVADIRAAEFFTGALGDTLASLELRPLSLSARVRGQLDPGFDLELNGVFTESGRGTLLDFSAQAAQDNYRTTFSFDHRDLAGTGNARYTRADSVARAGGTLQLRRLDLQRWHLSEQPLSASGSLTVDGTGLQLDSLDAYLALQDLYFRGNGTTSYIDSLVMRATLQNGDNAMRIRSDLLDADLSGQFQPDAIVGEFSRFLRGYWSESITQPDPVVHGNRVVFDLDLKNPRPLTRGLVPGLTEAEPLRAHFVYRDEEPELRFSAALPHLVYGGVTYDQLAVEATGDTRDLRFAASWDNIVLSEQARIGQTRITGRNERGGLAIEATVLASESDSIRHRISMLVDPETDSTRVVMDPTQVINFNPWNLPPDNRILLDSNRLSIRNWILQRDDQSLGIATTSQDDVTVAFDNFNLATISRFINTEEELIGGRLNGTVYLDQVLSDLGIRSDVSINDLAFREQSLGNLTAAVTSPKSSEYSVDATLQGAGNDLRVAGTYRNGGRLDFDLEVAQLQLASAEPFSLGYLQQTDGYLTGRLGIEGSLDNPRLTGQVRFQEAALAISILGSRYRVGEQPIRFTGDRIRFDDFTLRDSLGNRAVTNGEVLVRSLSDYAFDLRVRARDFLALNSSTADNELYYGYLVVDADVDIGGDIYQPEVLVTATPKRDSRLTYDYAVGLMQQADAGVSEQRVVRFAERFEWDDILRSGPLDTLTTAQQSTGTFIQTNLSITDDLLITVVIDPVTNQEFSGRGEGDISFTQYPNGRQEMTGQIEMVQGTYDLVLENIQSYEFQIDPGSRVFFTGDVTNPQLDLAISTRVSTSPLPLVQRFQPEGSLAGLRQRETFVVELDLDGDLRGMQIAADIDYPVDEYGNAGFDQVEKALEALRQDESQMYTTALTLVTFRSFVIPLTGGDSGNPDAIRNGVAGAITGALNSLVNQNLGFVELDFGVENYQTAAGEENYNLRVSIRKSFLNDRLIVNVDGVTNTATDETTGDAQTYLDNISVEYLLNERGNLRIKLFNDRDRNVFVGGNVLRFGGRLVFSKDFNKIRWFARKEEPSAPVRTTPEEQAQER
jgi:hypothetical protein